MISTESQSGCLSEKPCELSEQEYSALVKALLLNNELASLELEQVDVRTAWGI
ncbi:hypothetical protein [Scatolibacter rhodanostii]|uniref:hypothetical protein n=1 Tax=Scatolibacter rhodanostii TaxID=2014781 RepID=UPI0013564D2F|nr:hypothetical protein [Scatolibacter rhodanostii]